MVGPQFWGCTCTPGPRETQAPAGGGQGLTLALLCLRNQRERPIFRYSILPLALPSPKPPKAVSSLGPAGRVLALVEPRQELWGEVIPPYTPNKQLLGSSFSSAEHFPPLPCSPLTPNLSMEATSL